MITPDIYQDYSEYLSSILEYENTINDLSMLALDAANILEAPVRDPSVLNIRHELGRIIINNNVSFIDQYYNIDSLITALQQSIINSYGDLNEYLQDNDIQVGYYFAQSSDRLGFTINDENVEYVILDAGSTYTVDSDVSIKFDTTDDATTATIIVNGTSFAVAIVNDQFVWDLGGAGEHTFIVIEESIARTVGVYTFYITWMGYSSFLFAIDVSPTIN